MLNNQDEIPGTAAQPDDLYAHMAAMTPAARADYAHRFHTDQHVQYILTEVEADEAVGQARAALADSLTELAKATRAVRRAADVLEADAYDIEFAETRLGRLFSLKLQHVDDEVYALTLLIRDLDFQKIDPLEGS